DSLFCLACIKILIINDIDKFIFKYLSCATATKAPCYFNHRPYLNLTIELKMNRNFIRELKNGAYTVFDTGGVFL
ncbi:MAG: hypothetical protein Q7U83_14100, partial [Daejeonella sp.]|nr:hypothetical protein [Daejeonella sp.]